MQEFSDVVQDILETAAASGGELDGLTIAMDDHGVIKDDTCTIDWDVEPTLNETAQIAFVEGRLILSVYKTLNKKANMATERKAKREMAESWARKVRKVIMANPELSNANHPNGITKYPDQTRIDEKRYGSKIIDGVFYTGVRMTLRAHYLYRDGVLSLS